MADQRPKVYLQLVQSLSTKRPEKVYFGRLKNKQYKNIVKLLSIGNSITAPRNEIWIHTSVINKLKVTKINEKLTAHRLAAIAISAVHGQSHVVLGRYENTVKLIKIKTKINRANIAIIGIFEGTFSVKSIYPKTITKKTPLGGGRKSPPSGLTR